MLKNLTKSSLKRIILTNKWGGERSQMNKSIPDLKKADAGHSPKTWIFAENLSYSGIVNNLLNHQSIRVVTKKELQKRPQLQIGREDKVIVTTETMLKDVLDRLEDPEKKELILRLKNKASCRRMLASIFPDFFFREITHHELTSIELDPHKKYFIKPIMGYWGTAAFPLDAQTDRSQIIAQIESELKKRTDIFSEEVISKEQLIIEEFIEGEEYAVDMFFDEDGQPVIMNLYHHPIPKKANYLHVIYYTSYSIFQNFQSKFIEFFAALNKQLQARSFAIHGEFRLCNNKLVPIELNPLRFGSDCLCDLAFHAFGFNPFLCFAQNQQPDFHTLWKKKENKFFAFYLGYNGSALDINNHRPDFLNFRSLFSNILYDMPTDYRKALAFSVLFIEEHNLENIYKLLDVEFNDYFIGLKHYSKKSYRALYNIGIEVNLESGDLLWEANDSGDYLVLILQGELDVFIPSEQGEVHLETYGPGSAVGELTAIDGLPRSASVRAKTNAKVMRIMGSDFRELLRSAPDILEDLFWQQVNRIRKLNLALANTKKL